MTRKTVMAACVATVLSAGCKDTTRTLAGGEQIDALHRMKTIAVQTEQQAAQRFNDGMNLDSHTQDLDEAARGE
jgi:hypothetical protein